MEEYIQQYFYTPAKHYLNAPIYITWAGHRKCGPDHVIGPRVLDTFMMAFVVVSSLWYYENTTARHRRNMAAKRECSGMEGVKCTNW